MISTRDDIVSLRDKISFFTQDAISAVRQSIADAFAKSIKTRPAASPADVHSAGVRLAEDSVAHLAMLSHDMKHGKRQLSAEQLAKLDAIQQMTEDLIAARS